MTSGRPARRREVEIAAALALVAALAGSRVVVSSAQAAVRESPSARSPARTYVVRPGDTVWRIAQRIVGGRADPRLMVDRLIASNHIHGAVIVVGERLLVPAGA